MDLAVDDRDALCGQFAADCTGCLSTNETLRDGVTVPLQCQFLAGSGCVSRSEDPLREAQDFSVWVARHTGVRVAGGAVQRSNLARPACRLILRDPAQCAEHARGQSDAAYRCATTLPGCQSCYEKGCTLCGLRTPGINAEGLVPQRCISYPCTTPCSGSEKTFDLGRGSTQGGIVEYPLWGKYGVNYAAKERCSWKIGVPSVGFVTGTVTHNIIRRDQMGVYEDADRKRTLVDVVNERTPPQLKYNYMKSPIELDFMSNGIDESEGFSFSWQYYATDPSLSSTAPPTGNLASYTYNSPNRDFGEAGEGIATEMWIGIGVAAAAVPILLYCLCCRSSKNSDARGERREEPDEMVLDKPARESSSKAGRDSDRQAQRNSAREFQEAAAKAEDAEAIPVSPRSSRTFERPDRPSRLRTERTEGSIDDCTSPRGIGVEIGTPRDPSSPRAKYLQKEQEQAPQRAPGQASQRASRASGQVPPPSPRGSTIPQQQRLSMQERVEAAARGAGAQASMRRQASLREAKERQTAAAAAAAERTAATRIARQVLPAPPDTLPTSATTSASIVYEALIDSIGEPEADRKTVLRELQRQWHPDKNPENYKEVSTALFQYINSISQVFLAGLDQHIASMPTPKVPTETK